MKYILLFAILCGCAPSEQEKQRQAFKDSLIMEQRKSAHRKDSIQKIVDIMERGVSEKQALQIIHETDSEMEALEKEMQERLKNY